MCARAKDIAQNAGGALSKAVTAAEDERRKLVELQEATQKLLSDAAQQKASAADERDRLARSRHQEELKFRSALKAELEFGKKQIRALIDQLTTDKSAETHKRALAASAELTARANEQVAQERALQAKLDGTIEEKMPLELKVGARAMHTRLGTIVEIIDIASDHLIVAAGALKMRATASDLSAAPKAKPTASSLTGRNKIDRAAQMAPKALTLSSPSIDVRGERAEDALRQLEQFLDRLARQEETSGLIIHGHGTGALKREIRDYLETSPYVASFRAGDSSEGSDGVTVIFLA